MSASIDQSYISELAKTILTIHSPSGFCHHVMQRIEQECQRYSGTFHKDRKGNGIFSIEGKDSSRTIGLGVHVDTLGAMVRSIDKEGRILFTPIGGILWPTADGEYCTIITRNGQSYSGTFLSKSPAAHVYSDAKSRPRSADEMYVRLDAIADNADQVAKLGIRTGDYICLDTKTQILENGFIKSRFLDDKINVSSLFGLLDYMKNEQVIPQYNLKLFFSTYEEVGHGAACIPDEIDEFIAVDMGCIGEDLNCNERQVSICAKDSSGPYDYHMVSHLIKLSEQNKLDYAVDIYPFYSSDGTAALHGGKNIRCALIGPGVHASHGMERTHYLALEQTIKLLAAYLQNPAD